MNFYFNENDHFTFDSNSQTENTPYSDIKLNFRSKKIYGSNIGMMFQNPSTCFNPYWTVDRHFDEIKRIYQVEDTAGVEFDKFKSRIIQKLFKETQSDEEMKDFLEKKPNQLSGGQKQRLVIALVIIRSPDLIIGDEIGTGIDLKIKKDIHDLLQDFRTGEDYNYWNPSLILISHDIGFAYKIVDKIIIKRSKKLLIEFLKDLHLN